MQEHGLSAGLVDNKTASITDVFQGASSSCGCAIGRKYPDAMPGPSHRMNRPVVAVLAVAAIAGVIRYAAIDDPRELVFDETYYAKAGCIQVTDARPKECRVDPGRAVLASTRDTGAWVHPPLGKITIGLGIRAFSMSSFGWRVTSALAGIGVAVFTALMAQLLFGRPVWTFVAGLLIAVDGPNVAHSRIALLDIHLAFWVSLGFLMLLLDRC